MRTTINLLTEWELAQVLIGSNEFIAASRPTTQEDNHHLIIERYDLYLEPYNCNNSIYSSMKSGQRIQDGHLVKYLDGNYAVFHGLIRYNLRKAEVIVVKLKKS